MVRVFAHGETIQKMQETGICPSRLHLNVQGTLALFSGTPVESAGEKFYMESEKKSFTAKKVREGNIVFV